MNASSDIRCVCFDWGGVILRICRSFAEGLAAAGLDIRPGAAQAEAIAERKRLALAYSTGRIDRREFLEACSRASRGAYSCEELERVNDAWLIEEYPGIADLIDDLHRVPGIETALLSNTIEIHWERQHPHPTKRIPHFPSAGKLKHRHASHLLGLMKPDPAIYLAFEQATGFAPHQILFFDDLADNVAAARARGWRAVQIDHTDDTAAQIRAALRDYRILN